MESFLLGLGVGFSFVARQKRMSVDGIDHYLDLLFYHRALRRLIAVELKIGDFNPCDKGQIEIYLAWLDRHERREGEDAPIGLILCSGKNEETVQLLNSEKDGIRIAAYLDKALPRAQLERKLHDAFTPAPPSPRSRQPPPSCRSRAKPSPQRSLRCARRREAKCEALSM